MEKRSVIGPQELLGSLKHRVQKMLPSYSQKSRRHHPTRENRCQGMRNVAVVKVSHPQHKTETMLIVSFAVLIFVVFVFSSAREGMFTGRVAGASKASGEDCNLNQDGTSNCQQGLICRKRISETTKAFYGTRRCTDRKVSNTGPCEHNTQCQSGLCFSGACIAQSARQGDIISIDQCKHLSRQENGKTYRLTTSLDARDYDYCIMISGQDITLDCNGHTIDRSRFEKKGIEIDRQAQRITIKNCRITDHVRGIDVKGGSGHILVGNTIEGNLINIEMNSAQNAALIGNMITGASRGVVGGIGLDISASSNIVLRNNTFERNEIMAIKISTSQQIHFDGNRIEHNPHSGISLDQTANGTTLTNNRVCANNRIDFNCGHATATVGSGNYFDNITACADNNWPTDRDYQPCTPPPPQPPAEPAPRGERRGGGGFGFGEVNQAIRAAQEAVNEQVEAAAHALQRKARDAECPSRQNTECQEGSVCRRLFVRGDPTRWSGSKYFCKGPMADGGICERNDQCGAGKSCVNHRCVAPQQPGQQQEQQPPPPPVPSCTDTDAGQPDEGRGVKGTATGIIALDFPEYGLRQGQQASYEDRCNGDMLLEGFCDRDGKVSITGFGCAPGGKVCRDGACVASQEGPACVNNADCGEGLRCLSRVCQTRVCSETDGGNDPAVPGVITLDNSITDDIINQDACQNDASVLEYFCLPSHESSRQVMMCPGGSTCQTNAEGVGACVAPEAPPHPPVELSENDACGENIPTPCRQGLLCRKSNPASQTLQCLLPSVQGGFCESTDHCSAGLTCQTGHCLPPPQCRTPADEQAHGGDCNHCVSMPELMRYIAEWNNQDPEQRQLSAIMLVTQGYYDSLADPACQQA